DNQIEALDKFEEFLADQSNESLTGYIVQPTGAGKTVLFGLMMVLIDLPAIVLVPDSNLLNQIKEELIKTLKMDEYDIGFLDGTHREFGRKFIISTYAMHNALCRSKNRDYRKQMRKVSLMICDEAHDALGKKTMERVNQLEEEKGGFIRIGFTATPRLIDKHVGDYFGKEIAITSFSEQVEKGVLVPMKLVEISASIGASELNGTSINEKNETRVVEREQIFERTLKEYLSLRKQLKAESKPLLTAVYLNRIAHAHRYAEMAAAEGLKTEVVVSGDDTQSDELRKRIKRIEADLIEGRLDMVIAVDKMAQGWDFVPLNCIILAAPMTSPKKIIQRIGRGARALEGKEYFYVIAPNFKVQKLRNSRKKGPVEEVSLREIAERTDRNAYRLGDNISVLDSLKQFGESEEALAKVCTVIRQNKELAPEFADSTLKRPHYLDRDFPIKYFLGYVENTERMRVDLEKVAADLNLPGISYLRICHFQRKMILANGQEVWGADYLKLMSDRMRNPKLSVSKGLFLVKQRLGESPLPLSDPAYFTPERVRADLDLVKFKSDGRSLHRDRFLFFFATDIYNDSERPTSSQYYLKLAKKVFDKKRLTHREIYNWLLRYAERATSRDVAMEVVGKKEESTKATGGVEAIKKVETVEQVEVAAVPEVVVKVASEPVSQVVAEVVITDPVVVDAVQVTNQIVDKLKTVLDALPDAHHKIGEAVLVYGKTPKEISIESGLPLGKVMMICARVKMLVRNEV
ncbi:DEAD/DEAH box helicase family protein, partial [Candidatus Peregrinibacteria bacterium]|nr:DEAD/DEAH box helicase family protein [Candidatus Peregrinibacteria bacterium]